MLKMKRSAGKGPKLNSGAGGISGVFLLLADNAIDSDGTVDILDTPFSEVLETKTRMPEQLLANGLGNTDPAWFRKSLEPRRNIYAVAVNVVFVDDDIAGIDPNAQLELLVVVGGRIGQAMLDVDGAAHRFNGAVELHKEPVAFAADESTLISADRRFDQVFDTIAKAGMRTLLVDAHQAAVPDHIRE
jgi:hypothetical protein